MTSTARTVDYEWVKFTTEVISEAMKALRGHAPSVEKQRYKVEHVKLTADVSARESWTFGSMYEFAAAYRNEVLAATVLYRADIDHLLYVGYDHTKRRAVSRVKVEAATRNGVLAVSRVFDEAAQACEVERPPAVRPHIFVGHGRAPDWRDLIDQLRDHHGFEVEAFESAPRAGQTAKEVVEGMAGRASFAVLVHTPEDEQADAELRARENVVHETGLFQGRLGFERAIIVRKDGCEEFSNVGSIQEVRYTHHIREAVGEVVASIRREFPD